MLMQVKELRGHSDSDSVGAAGTNGCFGYDAMLRDKFTPILCEGSSHSLREPSHDLPKNIHLFNTASRYSSGYCFWDAHKASNATGEKKSFSHFSLLKKEKNSQYSFVKVQQYNIYGK